MKTVATLKVIFSTDYDYSRDACKQCDLTLICELGKAINETRLQKIWPIHYTITTDHCGYYQNADKEARLVKELT